MIGTYGDDSTYIWRQGGICRGRGTYPGHWISRYGTKLPILCWCATATPSHPPHLFNLQIPPCMEMTPHTVGTKLHFSRSKDWQDCNTDIQLISAKVAFNQLILRIHIMSGWVTQDWSSRIFYRVDALLHTQQTVSKQLHCHTLPYIAIHWHQRVDKMLGNPAPR